MAAFGQRKRAVALAYVLKALSYEPVNATSWKWLVKTLVGSNPGPAAQTAAAKEA
jgi:hypothetical protein